VEDPLASSRSDPQLTEIAGKHLRIAYAWNVQIPEQSEVYALTFEDAMQVMEKRG
jgi:hypothetical protein